MLYTAKELNSLLTHLILTAGKNGEIEFVGTREAWRKVQIND